MENPLKAIRAEKGISRAEMSRRSGVPYPTLCTVETGLNRSMNQKTLTAIAEFSGKSGSEIEKNYKEWRQRLKDV